MNRAFELHKSGEVQAVVSAGNSGAAMAFAIFTLGRIPGVDRPAIATLHPRMGEGVSILLDAGGTVDCKPTHLAQFALMGNAFADSVLGIDSPKVGFLSTVRKNQGKELPGRPTPYQGIESITWASRGDRYVQRKDRRSCKGRFRGT